MLKTDYRVDDAQTVQMSYREAIGAALTRCLDEVPEALLYGEDVALPGGVFGVTRGLRDRFGSRVFDTPISESAILGSAIGAAMFGARPIVEIMWIDFSLVALDQIVNQLANVRYVSQGSLTAPVIIRTQQGTAPGACAQHSQSLEALFLHIPGLRVCMPRTPQDAYDALLSAIRMQDPVLIIENRTLYPGAKQPVQMTAAPAPAGTAHLRKDGSDVTVVTWGAITDSVLEAAKTLGEKGVQAEVIETPWLNPFPTDYVVNSVQRTGRIAVVHEANRTGGFGAEIVACVAESGVPLRSPAVRLGLPDVRVPAAENLMRSLVPDAASIHSTLYRLCAAQ
jgi:acetoin:2,6-dichlorophenolindophenol oxidoreductase subunit beta